MSLGAGPIAACGRPLTAALRSQTGRSSRVCRPAAKSACSKPGTRPPSFQSAPIACSGMLQLFSTWHVNHMHFLRRWACTSAHRSRRLCRRLDDKARSTLGLKYHVIACIRAALHAVVVAMLRRHGDEQASSPACSCGCRDAIEACEGLDGAEADACFLVFGLDCEQTRRWYPTVASLESALALPGGQNELTVLSPTIGQYAHH